MASNENKAGAALRDQTRKMVDRNDALRKIRAEVTSISDSKASRLIFSQLQAKYLGRTPVYEETAVLALARRLIDDAPTIAANLPPPKPRKQSARA